MIKVTGEDLLCDECGTDNCDIVVLLCHCTICWGCANEMQGLFEEHAREIANGQRDILRESDTSDDSARAT